MEYVLQRMPTTPGEILDEEFLKPLKITQKQLADHIKCDVKVINRIINGRCALTAEIAIKLEATFGMSAEFWLNTQLGVDIYLANKKLGKNIPKRLVKPQRLKKAV